MYCFAKSHTTLHQSQFFSDVLLCSVKSHTTLHQGQFFSDVLLCSVKSHTTLHQGQFFSDVLLCSVKSHTTLHQSQFFSDVLWCSVKSHTTLHQGQVSVAHHTSSFQVSEFYLPVTRKYCFPTSFDYLCVCLIYIYILCVSWRPWCKRPWGGSQEEYHNIYTYTYTIYIYIYICIYTYMYIYRSVSLEWNDVKSYDINLKT